MVVAHDNTLTIAHDVSFDQDRVENKMGFTPYCPRGIGVVEDLVA
jgi:hypothetical protein